MWIDDSPSSKHEIKKCVELYLHPPHIFVEGCFIEHRDNFTFAIPKDLSSSKTRTVFSNVRKWGVKCEYRTNNANIYQVKVNCTCTSALDGNQWLASRPSHFTSKKELAVSIPYKVISAPEPVWTLRKRDKLLPLPGIEAHNVRRSACSPVAVPPAYTITLWLASKYDVSMYEKMFLLFGRKSIVFRNLII